MEERRPFEILDYFSQFGRSNVEIRCPFCGEIFIAYVWSMAGCGKKCPSCGAKHWYMERIATREEPPKGDTHA